MNESQQNVLNKINNPCHSLKTLPITIELAKFFTKNTPSVTEVKFLDSGSICIFFGEGEEKMVEFDGWKIRIMYLNDGVVSVRDCSPGQSSCEEGIYGE